MSLAAPVFGRYVDAERLVTGVAASVSDGRHVPLALKRAAFAEVVRAVLARHDPTFLDPDRVATAVRAETLGAGRAAHAERTARMGDPARYAEVLWRGPQGVEVETLRGSAALASHTVLVAVYWGAHEGSDDEFTDAMESTHEARPGLLCALRDLGAFRLNGPDAGDHEGATVEVSPPLEVRPLLTPARAATVPGLAGFDHECHFLTTLTG